MLENHSQGLTDVLSILSQTILQSRASLSHPIVKRLPKIQQQLYNYHMNADYSQNLYAKIIQKQQYGVRNKLIKAYQTNIATKFTIQIIIIIKNRQNDQQILVQKWLIRANNSTIFKSNKQKENAQLYLIEQVLRALRCQTEYNKLLVSNNFYTDYKFKLIPDSHVEFQKSKKQQQTYNPFDFDCYWQKSAYFQNCGSNISISSFYKHLKGKLLQNIICHSSIQPVFENKQILQKEQLMKKHSFSDETSQSTEELLANINLTQTKQKYQPIQKQKTYKRSRVDSVFEIKDKQFDFIVISHRKISEESVGLHHSQIQKQVSVQVNLSIHQSYMKEQQNQSSGQFQILDYQIDQKISHQIMEKAIQQLQNCLQKIDEELQKIL